MLVHQIDTTGFWFWRSSFMAGSTNDGTTTCGVTEAAARAPEDQQGSSECQPTRPPAACSTSSRVTNASATTSTAKTPKPASAPSPTTPNSPNSCSGRGERRQCTTRHHAAARPLSITYSQQAGLSIKNPEKRSTSKHRPPAGVVPCENHACSEFSCGAAHLEGVEHEAPRRVGRAHLTPLRKALPRA